MVSANSRRRVLRLVSVYATQSGRLGACIDSAKRLLMVKGCPLRAITHSVAGERSEWREFREEIGVPIDSFHRDDMPPRVAAAAGNRLPCVLADTGEELVPLLPPEVIAGMRGNVADFRGLLLTQAARRRLDLPLAGVVRLPSGRRGRRRERLRDRP